MATKRRVEKTVERGSSGIPIEWDLNDIELDFARNNDGTLAIFGCGCSSFTDKGKLVTGAYNLKVEENVSKTFLLYLDDGKDLETLNKKGVMARNPLKKYIELSFKIVVRS